jgi:hypothetical protein
MSREDPQMKIRLPAGLKDRIEFSAKENNRSMNAEIISMLQGSIEKFDADVASLTQSLNTLKRSNESSGLNDPHERAALLKVLLLEELLLLKRRVSLLGGTSAVLEASKAEIAKRIEGPLLRGTSEEQKSHFSQILPSYPLSALMTSDELGKLAERIVALQAVQAGPSSKKP